MIINREVINSVEFDLRHVMEDSGKKEQEDGNK